MTFFANVTSVELTGPWEKQRLFCLRVRKVVTWAMRSATTRWFCARISLQDTWKEKAVGKYTLTLKAGYGYETQKVEFEIKAKEETACNSSCG